MHKYMCLYLCLCVYERLTWLLYGQTFKIHTLNAALTKPYSHLNELLVCITYDIYNTTQYTRTHILCVVAYQNWIVFRNDKYVCDACIHVRKHTHAHGKSDIFSQYSPKPFIFIQIDIYSIWKSMIFNSNNFKNVIQWNEY